jgi:hypothetical protein
MAAARPAALSLVGVNTRRDGMPVIRADSRRATAESREQDNGAERGEKNGSHSEFGCFF